MKAALCSIGVQQSSFHCGPSTSAPREGRREGRRERREGGRRTWRPGPWFSLLPSSVSTTLTE
jgi:hypothetical protein